MLEISSFIIVCVCDTTFCTKPKTTNPDFPLIYSYNALGKISQMSLLLVVFISLNFIFLRSSLSVESYLYILSSLTIEPIIFAPPPPSAVLPTSCKPHPAQSAESACPSPPPARSASPGSREHFALWTVCGRSPRSSGPP